jgi:hypothetical protein
MKQLRSEDVEGLLEEIDSYIDNRYVQMALLAIAWDSYIIGRENEVGMTITYDTLMNRDYYSIASYLKGGVPSTSTVIVLFYVLLYYINPNGRWSMMSEDENIILYSLDGGEKVPYGNLCSGMDVIDAVATEFFFFFKDEGDYGYTYDIDKMVEEMPPLEQNIDELTAEDADIPYLLFQYRETGELPDESSWLDVSLILWKLKPIYDKIMRDLIPHSCIRRRSIFSDRRHTSDIDVLTYS